MLSYIALRYKFVSLDKSEKIYLIFTYQFMKKVQC